MTETKITYSLPRFDDWQADAEWRVALEADAYVDAFPVGRDVYLTGRVSWRTIPGKPDSEGWQYGGSYLYRVTEEGSYIGDLDPTEKMAATVREAVAPDLIAPSDALRLETAKQHARNRVESASDTYKRELRDTIELSERFAKALAVDAWEVAS